ncbi:MAG: hypothetical protein V1686_00995 [Patescibacteria group bacterium]
MKNRGTVRLATPGQIKDLISALAQAIPANLTFTQASYGIGHKKELAKKVGEFFRNSFIEAVEDGRASLFPRWKTIVVGAYQSTEVWIEVLSGAGFRMGLVIRDLLSKTKKFQDRSLVSFARATGAELGFTELFGTTELIARIREFGGEPCNSDDAPALRQAYTEQPDGECLYVVVEPICGSDGRIWIYELVSSIGMLCIDGNHADPGIYWSPDYSFVFRIFGK